MDKAVSFEEAATMRPDGGHNICQAFISTAKDTLPKYHDSLRNLGGPCWNRHKEWIWWFIDNEWSERRLVDDSFIFKAEEALKLIDREYNDDAGLLSADEYAFLVEFGIMRMIGNYDDIFKTAYKCVFINGKRMKDKMLSIGDKIKEKHFDEFNALKKPFIDAVLRTTPKQLHTMKKFCLQSIFTSDGYFMAHCLKELVNNGKLKLPDENEKKSLSMLIIRDI